MRRFWLADLLGSLRYLGQCFACRRQFMSVNQYVWRNEKGALFCERCKVQ